MLGASAVRYWPFGPTRTNLYVVPLFVVVVMVGAERVIRSLLSMVLDQLSRGGPQQAAERSKGALPTPLPLPGSVISRSLSDFSPGSMTEGDGGSALPGTAVPAPAASPETLPPALAGPARVPPLAGSRLGRARAAVAFPIAVVIAITGCGVLLAQTSLSGSRPLWEHRDRLRGLDLMVDAALVTRRVARPGDVVAVGGRLARPGWLYAMEVSDDGPRDPADLLPGPGRDQRSRPGGAGGTADAAADETSAVGSLVTVPAPRGAVGGTGGLVVDGARAVGGHRPTDLAAGTRVAVAGGGWYAGPDRPAGHRLLRRHQARSGTSARASPGPTRASARLRLRHRAVGSGWPARVAARDRLVRDPGLEFSADRGADPLRPLCPGRSAAPAGHRRLPLNRRPATEPASSGG